jgi:hypothetical protein
MSFSGLVAHERARVLSTRCLVSADVADRLRRAVAAEMLRRSLSWSAFAAEAGVGKATAHSWRGWICGRGSPTIASAERAARWLDRHAPEPLPSSPEPSPAPQCEELGDAVALRVEALGWDVGQFASSAQIDLSSAADALRGRADPRVLGALAEWLARSLVPTADGGLIVI